jgi:hypothetical protein
MTISIGSSAFKRQSVKAFWQGVNWENRAVSSTKSNFSLTVNVQDYFGMIPWSGVAIAQSVPKPIMPQNTDKSETLEDFLDDISKFF